MENTHRGVEMWKYPQKTKDIHNFLWISTGLKGERIVINSIFHKAVDNFVDKPVSWLFLVKNPVNWFENLIAKK